MAAKVISVDFLQKQNSTSHHTKDFNTKGLAVRRGQEFTIKLSFDVAPGPEEDITLQFALAGGIDRMKNTSQCLVCVKSPADAVIGKYDLTVKTGTSSFKPPISSVYILFNPWWQDDDVFMPDDADRNEYVLADSGYIYYGSVHKISARPWNFGQYEDDVLDTSMYLLDKSGLKSSSRKDPVIISRAMSAQVNANDDNGVLTGNWSGKYDGGMSPLSWTGSAAILQKYYKTRKPINFGQCWVYSGVLTTVLRCLGIPVRSVTNFASAHDTENNLKVDIYLNEKGQKIDEYTLDSVWNYHVWNDVWMKRPDLPKGFDGWQALDATPQEPSEGIFQCGPCPLEAIRTGEVYLQYDAKFIFAEVNADKIIWKVKNVGGKEEVIQLREERSCIGKFISTKAVNKNTREDITCQYKWKEDSSEERDAMQKACSYLKTDACNAFSEPPPPSEVKLNIINEEDLWPGNPLDLEIVVSKDTPQTEAIDLTVGLQLQTYTGKTVSNLQSAKRTIQLGADPVTIPLQLPADIYMDALLSVEDDLEFKVNVISECVESGQKHSVEKIIAFQYPPVTVDMPESTKINQDFTCTITFKNHLSIPMENCKLHVEGLGIFKRETFVQGDLPPGDIFRSKVICAPIRAGTKKIVVKLNSKQIKELSVERMIEITE